jgi:hypothetical protein
MLDANTVAQLNQLGISTETIESALSGLVWLTALSVAAAIPTVILAKRKGRSVAGWLILALTIPVIPLLLIWFLPRLPEPPPQ